MNRPPEFDVLFESVRIGPVTARNRFFQVPHCNGMGRAFPSPMAAMRGVKAEGGWGAVCTEQCEIHPSGNHMRELRLWDEKDIPYLARAADQIHEHGALAGIELVHNGHHVGNLETRIIPIGPGCRPVPGILPVSARAMDRDDILAFRRWHRTAATNAQRAGFDIVYIYAGHDISLPAHFLSRRHNHRTDEYGGSLEGRARLLRELVEDTKDTIGESCAVALRMGADRVPGPRGGDLQAEADDARAVIELLADLPDMWDVNLADWNDDGASARFTAEGYQEEYVRFVKSVTTRPVVGVGRFTSPDTMLRMIRSGVLDLIGAARPSIADPFLPAKIEQGRFEDIRECVGCNVCVAWDKMNVPIRCTQNPTMGEEWRRGWHPERIPVRDTDDRVLVVGGGPAGLEAARALGQRGYEVFLAERERKLGGRVVRESTLPGLGAWRRVADWRIGQLRQMPNVTAIPGNSVTVEEVLAAEATVVAVATGATWRVDGVGRYHDEPIPGLTDLKVLTPDDVMAGRLPAGRVVVFDDDHNYLGGVVAELLLRTGCEVAFVTPESIVSAFTAYSTEQRQVQRRLMEACSQVHVSTAVVGAGPGAVTVANVYTGALTTVPADTLVLVTAAIPRDDLYHALRAVPDEMREHGVRRVVRIGDCLGPGLIAAAVHSGHSFARTLDARLHDRVDYRRENVDLAWDGPLPTADGPTPENY